MQHRRGRICAVLLSCRGPERLAVACRRRCSDFQNSQILLAKPQSDAPDATGYKGFYYHFLDMRTGKRVWQCELSLIDTALLIAGVLVAGCYFDAEGEREIRETADALYRRVDWRWAQNGSPRAFTGMDAGVRVSPLWLGGIQRSGASLRSRSWLADLSADSSRIRHMAADLSVGKPAGPGCPLFRSALHSPVLPCVDRLSWRPRRVHA